MHSESENRIKIPLTLPREGVSHVVFRLLVVREDGFIIPACVAESCPAIEVLSGALVKLASIKGGPSSHCAPHLLQSGLKNVCMQKIQSDSNGNVLSLSK